MNVERGWQQVAQRLQAVIDLAHEAERSMLTAQRSRHRLDVGIGEEDSVASELAAVAHQLQGQKRLGQQALSLSEDDNVYWLRMPPSPPPATQQMAQQRQTVPLWRTACVGTVSCSLFTTCADAEFFTQNVVAS